MFSFQSGGKNTLVDQLRASFEKATDVRIAVAWTRLSGLDLIWDEMVAALERDASIQLLTGVDGGNTSIEAMRALVDLQENQVRFRCLIRHQEGRPLFHPKLYGFSTDSICISYVGSSNLTAAGLHSNDELSVRLELEEGSPELASFNSAWSKISDEESNLVRRLDGDLCKALEQKGYLAPEAASRSADQREATGNQRKKPLFGSKPLKKPPFRGSVPILKSTTSDHGSVSEGSSGAIGADAAEQLYESSQIPHDWSRISILLLKSRGTQSQLPKAVFEAIKRKLGQTDMLESCEVRDRSSGGNRRISPVGQGNTYKLETGLAEDVELVAKFEAFDDGVQVEFFNTAEAEGKRIFKYLKAGEKKEPPLTVNVKPTSPKATLYRVD
ncbi:MAG: phospholipase D-like domain-containing protein [Alteraurantiacibacter sp. bin_em_oilr2.035]|nr:phospholipase D-like domain-containing protein [Alteraurantiacibacter sp. bin_em_oilr2.035]